MPAVTFKGAITAGSPIDLSKSQVQGMINVADGATKNQSDLFLMSRSNHTGVQAISTVSGLETTLTSKQDKLIAGNNISITGNEISATTITLNNTLNSTSTTEALTAAMSKKLNEDKFDRGGGVITGTTTILSNLSATTVNAKNGVNGEGYDLTSTLTLGSFGQIKLVGNALPTERIATFSGEVYAEKFTGNASSATKLKNGFTINGTRVFGDGEDIVISGGGTGGGIADSAIQLVDSASNRWFYSSSNTIVATNNNAINFIKTLPTVSFSFRVSGEDKIVFRPEDIMLLSPLRPSFTKTETLGVSGGEFKDCYLQNAPIITSDFNAKTEIVNIDDAERNCAKALRKCIKKYKLKSAVSEKGKKARFHIGVIAQEVVDVFKQHSLDAFDYGVICYSEWEETPEVKENGVVTQEKVAAGSAYAVRYDELSMFMLAAL